MIEIDISMMIALVPYILFSVLVVILIIVYLLDINYFLRVGITLLTAFLRRRQLGFMEESVLHARVLPFDADVLLTHMNNARVLREFDFGRFDWTMRTGLVKYWLMEGSREFFAFVAAQVIRYRRPLHMFMKYKITTRAVYWEGKSVYLKHKIVTLNDGIVRCIGYSKFIFPFNMDRFVLKHQPKVVKPEPPEDLAIWLKFNHANGIGPKKRRVDGERENEAAEWILN